MNARVRHGPRVRNLRPEVSTEAGSTTERPIRFKRRLKSRSSRSRSGLYPPSCRKVAARTNIP